MSFRRQAISLLTLSVLLGAERSAGGSAPSEFKCDQMISAIIWNDGYNLRERLDEDPKRSGETFYLLSAGKSVPLNAAYGRTRGSVRYRGGPSLSLYREPPVSERPLPEPVAKVSLDSENRKSLLVLLPDRGGLNASFDAIALKNDNEGFPEKALRIFNLYDRKLEVKAGDEITSLAARESRIFKEENAKRGRGIRVQIVVFDDALGHSRPLLNRFVKLENDRRTTLFLLGDPFQEGSLNARVLVERISDSGITSAE